MGPFGTPPAPPPDHGEDTPPGSPERRRDVLDGYFWERRRRGAALPLAAGLVGLATLGAVQQWPVRHGIERDLTDRSHQALTEAGLPSVRVSFDGRDGVLTGRVGSDGERAQALAAVEGLHGVRAATDHLTGPATGTPTPTTGLPTTGATSPIPTTPTPTESSTVPSGTPTTETPTGTPTTGTPTTGTPTATPTTQTPVPGTPAGTPPTGPTTLPTGPTTGNPVPTQLSVRVSAGKVTLTGRVPDAPTRTALIGAVRTALPGAQVRDRLTVDPQAGGAGLEHLPMVLRALGPDSTVTVQLSGGTLVLAGGVPSEARKAAAVTAGTAVAGDPAAVSDQLVVDPRATVRSLLRTLPPVTFRTAYSTLAPRDRRTVREISRILAAHPTVRIQVRGYTDDIGAADMNYGLSYARARTVYRLLRHWGIPASRLTFKAFGEKYPKVPNTGTANRAANRRVEFEVLP